jgi:hypothetical protein
MEALVFRPRAIRGNFALFEALQDDPNPKVREAAKTVVEQYRERIAQRDQPQP